MGMQGVCMVPPRCLLDAFHGRVDGSHGIGTLPSALPEPYDVGKGSFSEMHSSVEPLALPHELLLWWPGSPRIPSMALQLECYGRQF